MPRNLKPTLSRPPDFLEFWDRTRRELESEPASLRRTPAPGEGSPGLKLEEVTFASLGGAVVHGYFLFHDDGLARPLVVHAHGYGHAFEVRREWAAKGLHVAGVDIRGFGRSTDALKEKSPWGFMLTGAETPETHALRGAVCDYIRLAWVAREALGPRVGRTILHGASFAGGLALMAEATIQTADLLVIAAPTFGWAEARQFFVKSGSGSEINAYLAQRPQNAEDLMLVLRYFDPMNFAELLRCPTLLGIGMKDDVVPAETVYAIANHLSTPHEIMEFPVSHSDSPEEWLWERFEARWLHLAIEGCPADFGSTRVRRE